ncbi:unnamed protein product [Aphanomyces euteiches]
MYGSWSVHFECGIEALNIFLHDARGMSPSCVGRIRPIYRYDICIGAFDSIYSTDLSVFHATMHETGRS